MTTAPELAPAPYIVMVDDEEDLREPIAAYLREQGVEVGEAGGGAELDALLLRRVPALVVLDVTMPDEDGFSIARRLRAKYDNLGIVMLTARRDVIDRVVGLELGADDYIMKPFEPRELLARIRSVLRRLAAVAAAPTMLSRADRDLDDDEEEAEAPVLRGDYHEEFWIPTTRGQIRVQFVAESLLLSLVGGVGGVLIGFLVTTGYAVTQHWPTVVPVWVLGGGVAATAVIGAVAGLYPAIRAARLAPTEALASS